MFFYKFITYILTSLIKSLLIESVWDLDRDKGSHVDEGPYWKVILDKCMYGTSCEKGCKKRKGDSKRNAYLIHVKRNICEWFFTG